MWGFLRLNAIRRGIDPGELQRVRSYLESRYRLGHLRPEDPLQRPRNFFPGLTARPWHEASDFGWTSLIEASVETIRHELLGLLGGETFAPQRSYLARQGEWTTYVLWSSGLPYRDNLARCPRTAELLDSLPIPHTAGNTYFSALGPMTHVDTHCGPTNTRLRCHLGILIPDGCGIRVGSVSRSWEEGRCIIFDDSFEHEAWNEGDRHRYVLLVDFWHPELTPTEVWAITAVERLSLYTSQRRRRKRASR